MTSILQTLGLGPPNPAAYSDASAVASQQTQALGGLQSTVASVGTALTFAKTSGVSSSTLDSLQTISTKGNTLMSQAATMNPATLATRTAALNSELMVAQFNALNEQYTKTLSETRAIAAIINTRVLEIRRDSTTSSGIRSQYESLLNDVSGSVTLLLASPPVYTVTSTTSGSTGSSGSSSISSYVVPTVPTAEEYQSRLDTLDGLKEQEEGSGYTFPRIWRRFKYWCYTYLYMGLLYVFMFSSFIMGGILSSNAYVSAEPMYLPNRIFYFVYGALAFPISILAGCVKPPFWVAGLFPAYARVARTQSGGASLFGSALSAVSSVKPAGIPTLPTSLGSALTSVKSTIPSNGVVDPLVNYGIIKPSDVTQNTPPVPVPVVKPIPTGTPFLESGKNILPPYSYDLFSYVLVDEKTPPEYQVTGKNTMWYLSLAHAIGLVGFAVSYGLLSKFEKGMLG